MTEMDSVTRYYGWLLLPQCHCHWTLTIFAEGEYSNGTKGDDDSNRSEGQGDGIRIEGKYDRDINKYSRDCVEGEGDSNSNTRKYSYNSTKD